MSTRKSKVAVIGAGPMGLMATYELLKQGHDVCLYERDHRIGGMTASFDLGGTKIERFYHFICVTDYPLFDLLKELNLEDKLVWTATKMGFFHRDKLHDWGDPISLLKFPGLSFLAKFRYGLHVLHSKRIKDWSKLDQVEATSWLNVGSDKKLMMCYGTVYLNINSMIFKLICPQHGLVPAFGAWHVRVPAC